MIYIIMCTNMHFDSHIDDIDFIIEFCVVQ